MLNYLLRGLLAAVAVKALDNYRHLSVRLLKIESAKSYVHGVRMARLSAVGLLKLGLVIGIFCMGALLFHAGLFILLPWTLKAKALLCLFMGAAYVSAGALVLRKALDEKMWLAKTGAAEMLREATAPSSKA